jgi:hypothetical protein
MADGALNQSMDEILAQIRKIIAEEPSAGVRPVAVTAPPLPVPSAVPAAAPVPPIVAQVAAVDPVVAEAEAAPVAVPPSAVAAPSAVALPVAHQAPATLDDLSDLFEADTDSAIEVAGAAALLPPIAATPSKAATVDAPAPETSAEDDFIAALVEDERPGLVTPPSVLVATDPAPAPALQIEPVAPIVDQIATARPEPTSVEPPVVQPPVVEPPVVEAVGIAETAEGPPSPVALAPLDIPLAAVAAVPPATPPITLVPPPVVAAGPVSLSSLFANRVDTNSRASGLLVPTHIGRTVEAKAPPAEATPPADVAPVAAAPAAVAADAVAVTHAAPVSTALGALAAGLAASGLVTTPPTSAAVVDAAPPAVASAMPAPPSSPVATAPAVAALSVDQQIEAIRPILKEWLDANMPRILDGALKEALPDLLARAKEAAQNTGS